MLRQLRILERAAAKLAPGRAPYFIEAHLVKALIMIDSESPVGRVKLAKALGLGEGTIRSMIRHLENEGLVKTSKAGLSLTSLGKKVSSSLKSRISEMVEVKRSSLTVGPFNVGILIKDAADAVKGGLEQRDAAIKVGALGATTLIYSHGRLNMPNVDEDVFRDVPMIQENLISKLKPHEKDVVIIGSAVDRLTAELGTIAATLETLKAH